VLFFRTQDGYSVCIRCVTCVYMHVYVLLCIRCSCLSNKFMKSQAPQIYEILGPTPYKFMKSQHIQPTTLPHRSSSAPPIPGSDSGSDHELLFAKFRLKLKRVGETTRPYRYDLNQIPYNYTVEDGP